MRTLLLLLCAAVIGCLPPAQRAPAAPAPQPYPQSYPSASPPYSQSYPPAPQPTPQPYPAAPQQAVSPGGPPSTYPPPPPTYPPSPTVPPVQPYAAPQAYPPPVGIAAAVPPAGANNEVIMDFAAVGTLASIDLLVRQDITNGSAGTVIVLAGLTGGGATGWLLSQRYNVDSGTAHATTLGLLVGTANGALLIEPTRWTSADQVLGLLLVGSAVGTTAGFAYGQSTELSSGQSTFIGNFALLGSSTAAFTAIAGSRDGRFGGWEDSVLAIGLDAGVLGGALIAPHLDWSPRRAKTVFASTAAGAFLGGLLVGLVTKRGDGDSTNGELVAGCMTAGMWGGFGLGILMTNDSDPDVRFSRSVSGPAVTVAPFSGERGQVGIMAGGSW